MQPQWWCGLLVGCLAFVAGCTPDQEVAERLLGPENTASVTCGPNRHGLEYFGSITIDNGDPQAAVIQSVELVQPRSLTLVQAFLVPTTDWGQGMGVTDNPARDAPEGWQWRRRIPAVGSVIDQQSPTYDLVSQVQLADDAAKGESSGVVVRYELGGQSYLARYPNGYQITRTKCF